MENEWKVDEYGKRYRETAPGHREYEPTITLSGIEIPVSQLDEYHRRQKEAEEKRRQAALEELKNRPAPRGCPFVSGMNTSCKREKCVLFHDGKCSIAILADLMAWINRLQAAQSVRLVSTADVMAVP